MMTSTPPYRPFSNRPYWYVVTCQGIIQGVYGSALYADACATANRVEAQTGFVATIERRTGKRPSVGASA